MNEQDRPSEPPQPGPPQPGFTPGQAFVPPNDPPVDYPPTSRFPPVNYAPPGYEPDYGASGQPPLPPPYQYQPPGHPGPGYPGPGMPPGPAPRKSNTPLIALILAVSLLLCGGAVTAVVLAVRNVAEETQEAVEALPTVPPLPTEAPELPELPGLPTDLPSLPGGKKITVTYEVSGQGPAQIIYAEKLGQSPQRVTDAKLPWKLTTTMEGAAVVSVIAVRSTGETGSITCRATVDGEEVAKRTAEGGWATAACNKLIFN